MTTRTCVHCTDVIRATQAAFRYPVSNNDAHLACVSQTSFQATDQLLYIMQGMKPVMPAQPSRFVHRVAPKSGW